MERSLKFEPCTALLNIKIGIYSKLRNGMLEPSAREFKEGFLAIEANSFEDCLLQLNEWAVKNGILLK